MERQEEEILFLEEENVRLKSLREKYAREAEELEKEVLVSKEYEKKRREATEAIDEQQKQLDLRWKEIEAGRLEIEEKKKKTRRRNELDGKDR